MSGIFYGINGISLFLCKFANLRLHTAHIDTDGKSIYFQYDLI